MFVTPTLILVCWPHPVALWNFLYPMHIIHEYNNCYSYKKDLYISLISTVVMFMPIPEALEFRSDHVIGAEKLVTEPSGQRWKHKTCIIDPRYRQRSPSPLTSACIYLFPSTPPTPPHALPLHPIIPDKLSSHFISDPVFHRANPWSNDQPNSGDHQLSPLHPYGLNCSSISPLHNLATLLLIRSSKSAIVQYGTRGNTAV